MSSSAEHEGSGFSVDDERTKQKELVLARSPLLSAYLDEQKDFLEWPKELHKQAKPYVKLFNEHTYTEWGNLLDPLTNVGTMTRVFKDKLQENDKAELKQISSYFVFMGHELQTTDNISLFTENISDRFIRSPYANETHTDFTKTFTDLYVIGCLAIGKGLHSQYNLEQYSLKSPEVKEVTVFIPGMFDGALDGIDLQDFTGKKGYAEVPGVYKGILDETDMRHFTGPEGVPGALFNWTPGSFDGVLENIDLDEFEGPPPKK